MESVLDYNRTQEIRDGNVNSVDNVLQIVLAQVVVVATVTAATDVVTVSLYLSRSFHPRLATGN